MDDELLARFHGYTQWAKQMHWNLQEAAVHKRELFAIFQQHKDNPKVILAQTENMKSLVQKKQLSHGEELLAVFHDIKESQKELIPFFQGMHAELFVKNVVNSIERMHGHAMTLSDVQQRQLRILNGMRAEICADLLPHLFFLYEKEKKTQRTMFIETEVISKNKKKLVHHMHENYITRLQKLHGDASFREDHRQLLQLTYLISLTGSIFGNLYGVSQKEEQGHENEFLSAVAVF